MVCSNTPHVSPHPLPNRDNTLDTSCSAFCCRRPQTQRRDRAILRSSQHNIFGSIGGLAGASATIQVDFRTADGKPLPYATVKGKGPEPEKHPLFTTHDTVMGDVRICCLQQLAAFLCHTSASFTSVFAGAECRLLNSCHVHIRPSPL